MARRHPIHDTAVFLQELISAPRMVGAIAPSSRHLARAMATWVPQHNGGFVLELGPGTGSVTQALLDRCLAPDRLIAVEKSVKLAEHLQNRFPQIRVVVGDAMDLESLLNQNLVHIKSFSHVISSLPLLNFPAEMAVRIARSVYGLMAPGAKFVQFSYHLGNHKTKALEVFRPVNSKLVWLNFPPARISVYEK
jgi:phosphatidylethanolamine/phosphatidyl-N-methylethanolamine N-methyltransferase